MLIDFHTHAFPEKISERAIGMLAAKVRTTPYTNGTISGLLEQTERCNVDRAVVCNIATNAKQMTNVNNFAIETMQAHGDRLTPLGSIHPAAQHKSDEIERLHNAGISGIKLHPDYMGFHIDDKIYDEIFDTSAQFGMFIVIHAGFDVCSPKKVWASPKAVESRLNRSPHTKLICAHFGGNMMWNEVEERLIGKNLYIDTSMGYIEGLSREQASRMLNKHGADNVLFGSDCPWSDPNEAFRYIDSLFILDDLKERIFYKNAAALLGHQV